ncbi:sensor histidine kinase [Duganella sp. FT80W]|uniref:histidine kinase n=1 Tax=Duganella guangzhouensis TaxID=2666084 RepID=A0A6I2L4L7_9BURK|nr:HAMP domain-containing sensor histidine kinase [Duganella guangzhouensis]MRW93255.1 sensor histidine kinase [Duganella guangzhouensis]
MTKRRASLVFKLTASLIAFQVVVFVLLLGVAAFGIGRDAVGFVDERLSRQITDAITLDADGRLVLPATQAGTLASHPALWLVASDESGRQLRVGQVPALYQGLAAVLPSLGPSDIRANRDPATLTSRVILRDAPFGRLHVLMGGVTETGPWAIFGGMLRMFGLHQMLPTVLVTLCVIPWLTWRALAGVARAAKQAEAINIRQRDARLSEEGLPAEIYPLVRAVNEALTRMSEGYEARDRFLAGAAHELRAPIAILEARIGVLVSGPARTRLQADVARLSNLAEALLDLQRLGRKLTDMQPVDLDALAHQVTSDMAPLVLSAGYEIEFNGGQGPVHAAGDALSLGRALINLVQNAIAHGGGKGTISIDVSADGTLSVRDQGPGVAETERERIFEPFYRIRPSDQGTGLGLHLVREIVDLHHGTVVVTAVQGGGACFQIRLPVLAP